jgi:hypothetical protein
MDVIGDPWLWECRQRGALWRKACSLLLATQILTAKHRGHVLTFTNEYQLRYIKRSAAQGRISNIVVSCTRCGWSATLPNWVRARYLREGAIDSYVRDVEDRKRPHDTEYLKMCDPGIATEAALALVGEAETEG